MRYLSFLTGTLYGELIAAGIVLFASVFLAKVVHFIITKYVLRITSRTATTMDDELIKAVGKLFFWGIILAGLNLATYPVSLLAPYMYLISTGFGVIWILWGLFMTMRLIETILRWYVADVSAHGKSGFDDRFMPLIRKILKGFIYAIAIILILNKLGVEITPLVAGLGVGGLAIALALQESLSNFFSGAYVITEGAIRIGDYIELENGIRGEVKDITWRSCKMRTWEDNTVIIPNSKLASSIVTNFYAPSKPLKFLVECGVAYGSNLKEVEKVAIEEAKKIMKKWNVKNYEPVVRFHEFGDSNINFRVVLKALHYSDRYPIIHDFIKALHSRFKKEKIDISWPVRKVYMAK